MRTKRMALLAFLPLHLYAEEQYIVYVGTYTKTTSKGIYAFRFHSTTGTLEPLGLAAEIANPSFLAVHPNGRTLYAVSESASAENPRVGTVSAFSVDPLTGKLNFLNKVSSAGDGPCYVSVDRKGRFALVANYGSGAVAVLPIAHDGSLAEFCSMMQHAGSSVHPKRQLGPHAHSIQASPNNRFVLAADLGLDKLMIYRFDEKRGTLTPNDPAFFSLSPGAGPRHFSFSPDGRFVYVINEINSTVLACTFDGHTGTVQPLQTVSTLPLEEQIENSTAEIRLHPNGNFLYGSNRGHNSIVVFRRDKKAGTLSLLEHVPTMGKSPRNFNLDPKGRFLLAANQNSDSIVIFQIDPHSGRLKDTQQRVEIGMPVCVTFLAKR